MRPTERERGAAAVEFALVLPVLVLLVLGIIDSGRLFNAQQTLTYAARSGAQNTSSTLGTIPTSSFTVSPSTCSTGTQVTFTVNYTFKGTGFFGSFPLQGKGVMLCGG